MAGIIRWWWLARAGMLPISLWDSVRLSMSGVWVSSIIPGGSVFAGDATKAVIFATENSKSNKISALVSIIIDRVLGSLAIFIISGMALLCRFSMIMKNIWLQMVGALVLLGILLLIGIIFIGLSKGTYNNFISMKIFKRIPGHKLILKLVDSFFMFRNSVNVLVKAHIISYLGHSSMIFAVFILAEAIGTDAQYNLLDYLFAISIGLISATIPISGPAGIGTGNVGFAASFALVNLNHGAEIALLWQVSYILVCQIGLFFFLTGKKRREPRFPSDASSILKYSINAKL
jgi:hypothetical protein